MRPVHLVGKFLQPLARKLPLLIAALLCAVVGTLGWLVERELAHSYEVAATERLSVGAQRIAGLLVESAGNMRKEVHRLSTDPAVIAVLVRPNEATRSAATALLSQQAPEPTLPASRALFTRECALVLAVGPLSRTHSRGTCPAALAKPTSDSASPLVSTQPLLTRGDSILMPIAAPVIGSARDTLGFLVQTRGLSDSASAQALGGLIGKDGTMLLGNASGPEVWTDLAKRVAGPPRGSPRGVASFYTPVNGQRQIGITVAVASTPWLLRVQIPADAATAGEFQTLRKLALIALACIVLGVVGAWGLSRHVTRPLVELKRAAEDLARGNYSRRVSTDRRDELGELMWSFNQMAAQVEEANHELSQQAKELEYHFHEAQDLAHELEVSNQELSEAADEALRAHRDRALAQSLLDEVLTQAPVGIAVFDEQLRYVRLNAALATMNGVAIEWHLGQTHPSVAQAQGNIDEKALRHVLATGQTLAEACSSEVLVGGVRRHWLTNYFPVCGAKGEVTGAGVIILDTTTRHDLEAQLLQSQKMEAVGRLAGGVAHDFNNLLTVISSYSEMALETLSPDNSLYGDMMEIRASADRASRLTRQLLAFSRKQVMQPQVLDLNRVATELEKMLRRLIGEDVILVLDLARDLGEVRADPGQIEQVLMNLVLNARDAMSEGGRLIVSTSNMSLSSEFTLDGTTVPPGEYVILSVSDTGMGMTEEIKAHLFEPFFTTKETGQGTGLGLSTVYGIIKQSGGEIHVRSAFGRGSTFVAFLPRIQRTGEIVARNSTSPEMPFGGSERVLLVEDDASLRNLARRILKDAGYSVLEARSATAAIDLGTSYPGIIDLLLTDVVMPHANGREVGERLKALRPDLRVLFMSGYTDDDVMKRGVSTEQTEFLQKPFTPEQLTRRVREVLDAPAQASVSVHV